MSNQQRTVTLPEEIWAEIDELAQTTPSELIRELVARGLRAYKAELAKGMELDVKILTQRKLQQRQGKMNEAVKAIKNLVDKLDGSKDLEPIQQALSVLEKGLSD